MVQLHFSLVSHYLTVPSRITEYDYSGGGSYGYAVPHLVADPAVTLFNPHPHPITVGHVRVRIWDPPVAFRLHKNGVWLRSSFANGEFEGIGRFRYSQQSNPMARKWFTLLLSTLDEDSGQPGQAITLQPGESKRFGPWVEPSWNWAFEYPEPYQPRSFFDFSGNFTNIDGRTDNPLGAECVPGTDLRAGFQWDHLSHSSSRPAASYYSFESRDSSNSGWVAIRLTDTVGLEARSQRTVADPSQPDFRISILEGADPDPLLDLFQDFAFNLEDMSSDTPTGAPPIARTFFCGSLLQSNLDPTSGGKALVASLTARAKLASLTRGDLETPGSRTGNDHFDLSFTAETDFILAESTPNSRFGADAQSPVLLHSARIGNEFRLALAAPADAGPWKIMGGIAPDQMQTDLTSLATMYPGPPAAEGTKVHFLSLDASGLGPRYFVQVHEQTADE